ncbi:glycosyltransferase family 2 protein [Pseudoalteromonas sp. S16_S37]|uniref:glycosyltransferase family 2 protein n=1 Tax=Pseudoalteromonas sp. S16_S37 TaxID=2720228 RepID=UPI0016819773|nr:glycosyltransferase family 2 protein [Pseudoalteromonas sp. S16_S37]MBD1580956.1 glycosyltransferase family 2 protein [Pseudoalteromonas sp. S16_S37]
MSDASPPLVSVLMPCYNAKEFLQESIKSVINQTYRNLEILCVDDGSTDNTLTLLQDLSTSYPQVKVFSKKNGGASSARNHALEFATGHYICMVDSDDTLAEDAIEKLLTAIQDSNADAGLFDLYYWDGGSKRSKFKNVPVQGTVSGLEATELSLDWSLHGVGMYKASIFSNIRYDESNLHGDELTTRELFLTCQSIAFSSGRYFYRQHQNSSTKSFSMARFGLLQNQMKLKSLLDSKGVFEQMQSRFCAQLMVCVWAGYVVMTENKPRMTPEQITQVEALISQCRNIIKQTFSIKVIQYGPLYLRLLTCSVLSRFLLKSVASGFVLLKRILKR